MTDIFRTIRLSMTCCDLWILCTALMVAGAAAELPDGGGGDEGPTAAVSSREASRTTCYHADGQPAAASTDQATPAETTTAATATRVTDLQVAGLRDRVARLTNELGKAIAALTIVQQREQKLALLEREKYGYVKAAADKVMRLVDNVQHAESALAADACRERGVRQRLEHTYRVLNRSGHRLQVIRRLLVGAEVGLVHMESNRKLAASNSELRKRHEEQQKRS